MNKKIKLILSITIITILVVATLSLIFSNHEKYNIFTAQVIAEYDDGRTFTTLYNEKGYGNENDAWALLQLSPSYSFGVRFINVSIPQGAKIKKAYVELYSIGTPGHRHPNCKIYCDDTDNAVNFSVKGVLDICGRNYTTNYTRWNTTLPYGKWVKTPSIAKQVQEVINRENWTSGNAIVVLFVTEGLRGYSATFHNYAAGNPAKLYIEWTK